MTALDRTRARSLAGLCLIMSACASTPSRPTHFGPWGPISPVRDPERAVMVAAVKALTAGSAKSVVLARYAGDIYQRLDLTPLSDQVSVRVDDGKLGPIDAGPPKYRAKVFELDFPGRTSILELSVPKIRGGSATLTAWRWDALAWSCELRGRAERMTLKLENGHWEVTDTSPAPGALLKADCP